MAKKKTELVLLFHKNITKLSFLWPYMSQKKLQCYKKSKIVGFIFHFAFFQIIFLTSLKSIKFYDAGTSKVEDFLMNRFIAGISMFNAKIIQINNQKICKAYLFYHFPRVSIWFLQFLPVNFYSFEESLISSCKLSRVFDGVQLRLKRHNLWRH